MFLATAVQLKHRSGGGHPQGLPFAMLVDYISRLEIRHVQQISKGLRQLYLLQAPKSIPPMIDEVYPPQLRTAVRKMAGQCIYQRIKFRQVHARVVGIATGQAALMVAMAVRRSIIESPRQRKWLYPICPQDR